MKPSAGSVPTSQKPSSDRARTIAAALFAIAASFVVPQPSAAYGVLAHETAIDAAWDDAAVPLLRKRFPRVTTQEITAARAYAYGGSLIQDLGYYPFGSHLFTNLTHYVRSGDFVEALLRDAQDVNEYAFALGALAHYACDNAGHPIAVNRAVPLMYPKVRARVGAEALYADSPARHVMVEFAFDVLQVARGAYRQQAYHDLIGFEVSKRLLEQAVRETYQIELKDMLLNVDLAIGTYRHAVAAAIPELTRVAWREKHDEIEQSTPGVQEASFVFSLSKRQYEQAFGAKYRKPGPFTRLLTWVVKILPKIGPMRPLAFEPLTPEAEKLFADSVAAVVRRYRQSLLAVSSASLRLSNTDFDTGERPRPGVNALADDTYVDWLGELSKHRDVAVSAGVKKELTDYFAAADSAAWRKLGRKKEQKFRRELRELAAPRKG
jgi:hypothetical protein